MEKHTTSHTILLADSLYLDRITLVKFVRKPDVEKTKRFAQRQEKYA
jgi:hypothetical protein